MTTPIIISICVLLLLAYVFDISSSKTKIPSVILLIAMGWIVKRGTNFLDLQIPDMTTALPVLGTIGLILIVLEGSLELELNKTKLPLIAKTLFVSFIPMLLFSYGLAYLFEAYGYTDFKTALLNAIPFAIISSAIAIPSAKNLISKNREFITYESSLSDIFGVIFFNFLIRNENITTETYIQFFQEIGIILVITVLATVFLAYLLSKVNHHVKFVPIILMIVLIYDISKIYHLPALIFILLFGLFLGNLDELKSSRFISRLKPEILDKEAHKFKDLTTEMAFLIRTLFFILFGFLIETSELLNRETIYWAVLICVGIFTIRFVFLKISRMPIKPLVFIAPRGLITILLFLSIPASQTISMVNNSLVIQVIILSALIMMIGLMTNKKEELENVLDPVILPEEDLIAIEPETGAEKIVEIGNSPEKKITSEV